MSGSCEYGVLARPQQTPFLLHYYPKAIARRLEELNALRCSRKVPLEIKSPIQGDRVRLSLLRDGTPVVRTTFVAAAPQANPQQPQSAQPAEFVAARQFILTDAKGQIRGTFSVGEETDSVSLTLYSLDKSARRGWQ